MTKPDDSEIIVSPHATVIKGPDAMLLYRAIQVRALIRIYQKTKMIPTRGFGITKLMAAATQITKKSYKARQYDQAVGDLDVWIATMRAALPITEKK